MKKLLISVIAIVIVFLIFFVFMKPTANAPTVTPIVSVSATPQPNITVSSPAANATLSSPFTVTGTERTFEQNVVWQLKTPSGTVVASGNTTGNAPDVGVFGPYSFTITTGTTGNLVLWVFDYSAKDGSMIDLVTVPITVL